MAGLPPSAFATGYVNLFWAQLQQRRPGIELVNYSCPGESTTTYRAPCLWKATGHALHDDYVGAQRDAALAFLRSNRGRVSPITVSLNGNDIVEFLRTCPAGDLACILQGAPTAIEAYRVRLLSVLSEIRSVSPESEIIVVGAINPNVGAFEFSDPLFQALNEAQGAAAAAVGGWFADPFPVFNPQGDVNVETATICALTFVCTNGDTHPNDAGYRALAEVVLTASLKK